MTLLEFAFGKFHTCSRVQRKEATAKQRRRFARQASEGFDGLGHHGFNRQRAFEEVNYAKNVTIAFTETFRVCERGLQRRRRALYLASEMVEQCVQVSKSRNE